MLNSLGKIRRFLNRHCPYGLPRGAPRALKLLWWKVLIKHRVRYLVAHLYTILAWKPFHFMKLMFSKNRYYDNKDGKTNNRRIAKTWQANIPVLYYYYFNFQSNKHWEQRQFYLYHKSLSHCLSYLAKSSQAEILNDKIKFNSFCQKLKIPTPHVYGQLDKKFNSSNYPWTKAADFVIKPITGSQGKDFRRYLYEKKTDSYVCSSYNLKIGRDKIQQHLSEISELNKQALLLQEKVENHKFFKDLSNDALSVIRILTVVNKQSDISFFRPIIKFPQESMETAYYHLGAITYTIDVESGQLGSRLSANVQDSQQVKNNIEGPIPFWSEMKNLLKDCHSNLKNIPLIGWDIAITDNGPCVIEGNTMPSLDLHQLEPWGPFIDSSFYQLFIYHLAEKTN